MLINANAGSETLEEDQLSLPARGKITKRSKIDSPTLHQRGRILSPSLGYTLLKRRHVLFHV